MTIRAFYTNHKHSRFNKTQMLFSLWLSALNPLEYDIGGSVAGSM